MKHIMKPNYRFIILIICLLISQLSLSQTQADSKPSQIFSPQPKLIVVNGYSTSFKWPNLLQRKLDQYFEGKRIIEVKSATHGGTPIAKWMDLKTGQPSDLWKRKLTSAIQSKGERPCIVLAQQSLQWAFGDRRAGIRNKDDSDRIRQGADILEKYTKLIFNDGADQVFLAMHIYKKPMEPEIGNERLALAELVKRKITNFHPGPDVWKPTRRLHPRVFARDRVHPNEIGAEIMAQLWFEILLKHDGLEVPPFSRAQMHQAIYGESIENDLDLTYANVGEKELKLDLYWPEKIEEPTPLVVWIHGGAWRAGDKKRAPTRMVRQGYVVASINYRLSQEAIFPAQIHDCKAAIRFLRANAEKYHIDPDHIGVWGSSAGGHLVALLGASGGFKELEGTIGGNLDFSSRVQAVCDFFGPTDFLQMSAQPSRMDHDAADSPESQLVGGPIQQNKDKVAKANPITYLTKDDPPFLILHGDQDPLVPHHQSVILNEALQKVGVTVTFHTVKGAGHGFRNRPEVDEMVNAFFGKHLKNEMP